VLLAVPPLDGDPWPTLGPQVCDWIEEHCVYGPGSLRGRPAELDTEKRAVIYSLYEVHPPGTARASQRRYDRAGISARKGWSKTELGAWVTAGELHPDAPVRCDGFDANGEPVGVGVTDPYIPILATAQEQADDLGYRVLYVVLSEGPLANDFDIGLEKITRKAGDGLAQALAQAPDSRDGALTTFQWFDETHRATRPSLIKAHRTMLANAPKRPLDEPWSLETTTMFAPGEGSIAESTFRYAQEIAKGKVRNPRLFFFHRQASDGHDLATAKGLRAAIREASGPAVLGWSDVERIASQWDEPDADRRYLERVWLNRPVSSDAQAFDTTAWDDGARPGEHIERGALAVLGFDGSRSRDGTALVATCVRTGRQELLGLWERPPGDEEWTVPDAQVNAAVDGAFERFDVWRLYADPWKWRDELNAWAGRHGQQRIIDWPTNRPKPMAYAVRRYVRAVADGEQTHDGNRDFARHIANAHKRPVPGLFDEDGRQMSVIGKERDDSPLLMDAAMAGCLSWEARGDAVAAGALKQPGPGELVFIS
jgi:hypothetical protein